MNVELTLLYFAITIVSSKIYENIPKDSKPDLREMSERILLADGRPMHVQGLCNLNMAIGHFEVEHEVLVADIESEGLLGSDFMLKNECVLNFKKKTLEIDGVPIPFREEIGSVSSCRVKVASTVTIPPGEEMVLSGRLEKRGKLEKCGIVEPSDNFVSKHGLLVGKTLVDTCNKFIPVRILNLDTKPKTVFQDTVVGTFESVVEVNPTETMGNDKQVEELPEYLVDLYDRSCEHLSHEQRLKLKLFLFEFQDVFAKNDRELGRTGLVKHSIDVGKNRPVKQPMRRLPIHQRVEEEKQVRHVSKKCDREIQ